MSALLAPGLPDKAAAGRSGSTLRVVAPEGTPVAMTVLPQRPGIADPDRQPALVRVLVLARSPAVRAGLGALLTTDDAIAMAAVPGTSSGWLRGGDDDADRPQRIDAIVVDLPGFGPTTLDDIVERYPDVPLVLIGGDPAASPAPGDAPIGYLGTEADGASLVAAVHAVVAGLTVIEPALVGRLGGRVPVSPPDGGGESLTPREREVLRLVAEGLPNKTIARELGISEHTAKFHVGSLLAKLDAGSRTEAVTTATRRGLLTV